MILALSHDADPASAGIVAPACPWGTLEPDQRDALSQPRPFPLLSKVMAPGDDPRGAASGRLLHARFPAFPPAGVFDPRNGNDGNFRLLFYDPFLTCRFQTFRCEAFLTEFTRDGG